MLLRQRKQQAGEGAPTDGGDGQRKRPLPVEVASDQKGTAPEDHGRWQAQKVPRRQRLRGRTPAQQAERDVHEEQPEYPQKEGAQAES